MTVCYAPRRNTTPTEYSSSTSRFPRCPAPAASDPAKRCGRGRVGRPVGRGRSRRAGLGGAVTRRPLDRPPRPRPGVGRPGRPRGGAVRGDPPPPPPGPARKGPDGLTPPPGQSRQDHDVRHPAMHGVDSPVGARAVPGLGVAVTRYPRQWSAEPRRSSSSVAGWPAFGQSLRERSEGFPAGPPTRLGTVVLSRSPSSLSFPR
jgi:hypothetical protein